MRLTSLVLAATAFIGLSACVAVPISPIGSPTPEQALTLHLQGRTFVAEGIAYTMNRNGILEINAFGTISNGTWSIQGNALCLVTPASSNRYCTPAHVNGNTLTITDPETGGLFSYTLT